MQDVRRTADSIERLSSAMIACGFLASLLIAARAWSSSRGFPVAPLFGLPAVPFPVPELLFAALVAGAVGAGVLRNIRPAVLLLCAAAALSALTDQTRFQPWLYQELLLLGCLAFLPPAQRRGGLIAVLAFGYVWSGLHKLNPFFGTLVLPWMLSGVGIALPASAGTVLLGVALAFGEALGGAGLLFRRTRVPAALGLILMHAVILLLIGPLGHGWNAVVWPWNLLLALLLACPIPRAAEAAAWRWIRGPSHPYRATVLLLAGVLPLFGLIGFWDAYPSFSLYSGNVDEMTIRAGAPATPAFPRIVRTGTAVSGGGELMLEASTWAVTELRVPAYPEARVLHRIARELCDASPAPQELRFTLHRRWTLLGAGRVEEFGCE